MTNRLQLSTHKESHDKENHDSDHVDEDVEDVKPALIFDAAYPGEPVPDGDRFNAVRIMIDGRIQSSLSWTVQAEAAHDYIKQGLRLFWEIDLGLFNRLERPLSDRVQFQSLVLSLEHFRDTLWKEFRQQTVGLSIYRGSLDFSLGYPWNDEQIANLHAWLQGAFGDIKTLAADVGITCSGNWIDITPDILQNSPMGKNLLQLFCRDAGGEYLGLLAARLPDPLPLFAFFDALEISHPYVAAQLLTKERYPRIHVGIKERLCSAAQSLGGEIAWEGTSLSLGGLYREIKLENQKQYERARCALCLPKFSVCHPKQHLKLEQALVTLCEQNIPFRIIPEVLLSYEWDDLDELIVDSAHVDKQLHRKLQGFSAAGGTVKFI
ncbi:MAG: hypothetical protein WCF65_02415 [Parachlamydiaceae bacterium]